MNPLRTIARTFDFRGRATRSEYWGYIAVQAAWFFLGWPLSTLVNGGGTGAAYEILLRVWLAIAIVCNIPTLALFYRRFHDVGRRATAWLLFAWFPLVTCVTIVICMRPGQVGGNRFGMDPRGRQSPDEDLTYASADNGAPSLDRVMNLDSLM